MKRGFLATVLTAAVLLAAPASGYTFHRSFRNGYPSGAQGVVGGNSRRVGVSTNVVRVAGGFAKFRHKSWVTGAGRVTRVLDDDLEPPRHQRFVLADSSGSTVLVAHNIDGWERVPDLRVGDVVAFRGEFIRTPEGGTVHWTHPDASRRKPGGWIKKIKGAAETGF